MVPIPDNIMREGTEKTLKIKICVINIIMGGGGDTASVSKQVDLAW